MHQVKLTSLWFASLVAVISTWCCLPISVRCTSTSSHGSVSAAQSDDNACHVTPCAPGCCTCTNDTATVVCNDLNITSVPLNLPPWTEVLVVLLTNITSLFPSMFVSVPRLTHLHLADNLISHIADDTFVNLTQLQELRLDFNLLTNVTSRAFASDTIKRLRLDGKLLSVIPDLGSTVQLQELYLVNNRISNVVFPEGFRKLLHLRLLYMDKNDIHYMFQKEKWKNLHTENIVDLSCAYCSSPLFEPDFFALFPNLRQIDLTNVYKQDTLESMLNELAACKKLRRLDISDVIDASYKLKAGFFSVLNGAVLEELVLSESIISYIPTDFFRSLSNLTKLTMKLSQIYNIERGAFDGLDSLRELYLDGSLTGFLKLGYGLFPPTLHILSLPDNYLPYLSYDNATFENLRQLKWLRLSNSFIDFIPPNVFPSSLEYLDLSNIVLNLGISQSMLKGLTNLMTLDLTSTLTNQQITPLLFNDLTNVSQLKLANNNLHDLPPGIFRNMKSIKHLDLAYNALSSFVDIDCEVFGALPSLVYVSFVRNTISHITETTQLKRFLNRNQTAVNLLDNTFDCSCENVLLYQLLRHPTYQQHFQQYTDYTCASPKAFTGRNLTDQSLVGEILQDCEQRLRLWEIVVMVAAGIVTVVALTMFVIYYKYKLYIRRLFEYRLCDEQLDEYDFYVSYHSNDADEAESIAAFIESLPRGSRSRTVRVVDQAQLPQQRDLTAMASSSVAEPALSTTTSTAVEVTSNFDSDSRERLLDESMDVVYVQHVSATVVTRSKNCVFYEDRNSRADEWDIEQLARAIYSSTSVILCLTPDYLKDRRRQYDMMLAMNAMRDRHGTTANDHIILITVRDPQEVKIHIPYLLRDKYKENNVIVWNEKTEEQKRQSRSALERKLQ